MLHPIVMATQNVAHRDTPLLSGYAGLADGLPCDIHLVNLRTLQEKPVGANDFQPKDEAAMLLHRFGHDCSFPARAMQCDVSGGKVALSGLFKDLEIAHAEETTLSLMHSLGDKSASSSIKLEPMEINTYKVRLK
ncbi:PREDICTED: alpha-mannosidase 2x-like [Priapulus caudatus]|uniref:Alpha-mannosidase 2x-like n=1 Tax=Priapulus caudatus TaxID=37621 RepID=A0ABM1F5T5_PRICU|nr:PREDICTED: alpha-mannosidase 2x-like [Priapulus caudatus]